MKCNKKIIETRKMAKKSARRLTDKFKVQHKAYKCPLCGYFHTTTHNTVIDKEIFRGDRFKKYLHYIKEKGKQ